MSSERVFSFDTSLSDKTPKTPKTPKGGEGEAKPAPKTTVSPGGFGSEKTIAELEDSSFGGSGSFGGTLDESSGFPIDALPPIARDMTREVAKAALVPDALAAVNVLGILSASIGGGLLVNSGGLRITPANLFLLGIAESGTGKGQAFSLASKSFCEMQAEEIKRWEGDELPKIKTDLRLIERDIKRAEKGIDAESDPHAREQATRDLHELEKKKADLERKAEFEPGFSVGDVTKEKLAITLASQPGQALASLSPEGRGVIDVLQGRYNGGKNSDEDLYLSGYSRESMKVSRVSRPPVHLTNPTLAVLWLIQPDKARDLSESPAMTESGLLPRFLLFDSQAEAMDEPEDAYQPDTAKLAAWADLVKVLLTHYREKGDNPVTVSASPRARKVIIALTTEASQRRRSGGDLKDLAPYPARWGENACRLALVLHAATHGEEAGSHPLAEETAVAAVEIVRWFIGEQLRFLAPSRNDRHRGRLRKLLTIIDDHQGERTLRALDKSHGFKPDEMKRLAKEFPSQIAIEEKRPEGSKGGRPSMVAKRVLAPMPR